LSLTGQQKTGQEREKRVAPQLGCVSGTKMKKPSVRMKHDKICLTNIACSYNNVDDVYPGGRVI
jgi:hypothetical protein